MSMQGDSLKREVIGGHQLDRLAAQQSNAVEVTLAEDEPAKARVVRRRRDEPAAGGNARRQA